MTYSTSSRRSSKVQASSAAIGSRVLKNESMINDLSMDSSSWLHLAVATAIISRIECLPVIFHRDYEYSFVKCNDIPTAIDYLHETIAQEMPLEKRCKKYAVMASFLASKGRPHSMAMTLVFRMADSETDQFYQRLKANGELPALYMAAIDGYRAASRVTPPFLELIDCLRQIDEPCVVTYLNNPELHVILDFNNQVLQSPNAKIDLEPIRRSHFSPAFLTSLRNIFKDNLSDDDCRTIQDQEQSDSASTSDRRLKRKNYPWGTRDPEQMVTTHRHREQERLRKYRLNILKPMERERIRERRRSLEERYRKERMEKRQAILRQAEENHQLYVDRLKQSLHQEREFQTQLQRLDQQSGQNMSYQQSPDLAQLWAEAAPIYESIPSPVISDTHCPKNMSAIHNMQASPVLTGETVLAKDLKLIQNPKQWSQISPVVRPQLVRPSGTYGPARARLMHLGLQPLVRAVTPVRDASTASASADLRAEDQSKDHNCKIGSKSESRPDTPALSELDQFEDIDSVLKSFSEIPQTIDDWSNQRDESKRKYDPETSKKAD